MDSLSRITLNWKNASINPQNRTFDFWNIELTANETDLIIKSYDSEWNIISKDTYTVYYNWTFPEEEKTKITNNSTVNSNTIKVDLSKFVFTAPWNNPYTTSEDFVTIRWTVPKWVVQKITVNWYTLQQFVEYSDNWRYHANTEYWNFQNWTNVYEVKYFWEGWGLVYANSFTIVKQ